MTDTLGQEICLAKSNAQIVSLALFKSMCNTAGFFPMSGDESFGVSKVVILDFGSQYTQVIARRIRECRVYSEILPFSATPDQIRHTGARGIILSGGPASVIAENAPQINPEVFELGIPVLGICYGLPDQ